MPDNLPDLPTIEASFPAIEVVDDVTHRDAAAALRAAAKIRDEIEARRKAEKQPHLDAGREVDAKYRPAIAFLDSRIAEWKASSKAYLTQRREEQEAIGPDQLAAIELAREALDAGDVRAAEEMFIEANRAPAPPPMPEGLSTRYRWAYEVVSPIMLAVAVSKEPAWIRFLTVHHTRVAEHVRRYEDQRPIPGIRIYREPIVATRRR